MPPFQQVSSSHFCPARAAPVKWKCCYCEVETSQPRSGRPQKFTEGNRRVLKRIAHNNRLPSVATVTTEFQTASGSIFSTRTVRRELQEICFYFEQPHRSLRSPCAMPRVGWSGVYFAAIKLWSSGSSFSGVMN